MSSVNSKSKQRTSCRLGREEHVCRSDVFKEKFFVNISRKIGSEWILLCASLGVPQSNIDQIIYDPNLNVQTKIYKGLLRWRGLREGASEKELLTELTGALLENGRQDLVEYIEEYLKENETEDEDTTDGPNIKTQDDVRCTILYSRSSADASVLHTQDESSGYAESTSISSRSPPKTLASTRIDEDSEIKELRERLIKLNCIQTKKIPLSPLQNTSTMTIEEIFAPVSIREDLEYQGRGLNIGTEDKLTKSINNPNEMFYVDGDMTQNIFMLGNAGIGKSVNCLRLVENWCKAKCQNLKAEGLNLWIEAMKEIDFLFYAQLRHVNKSRTSVCDMICYDVFKHHPECYDAIRRVISDVRYRCLIIMDGVDEWKISDEAKQKLTVEGLPNTEGMANCSFLWSMRPWVIEKLSDTILSNDRVIELQGLDPNSLNTVIEKLLGNFYKLDEQSSQYTKKFQEIAEKSRDSKLKSIMQIPLIALACIQLWYEEKDIGNSMTSLYVALLDLLIKRSNKKSPLLGNTQDKIGREPSGITRVPNCFTKKKRIKEIMSVIIKLGKIAYDDLISDETHLVFAVEDLEDSLKDYELDAALKIGLLSKCEAPGSSNDENVSLNFFHKSIQEFLSAIYIECSGEMTDFYEQLSTVEIIMELSNVLIFLSGLNPALGSSLSKHIVDVANADSGVCKYRTFSTADTKRKNKVSLLYDLQSLCYREMKSGQYNRSSADIAASYHVSDVVIHDDRYKEIIRTTADILTNQNTDIKSLFLYQVPTDVEDGIPDFLLTQYLDHNGSLQSLYIDGYNTNRTLFKINDTFSSLTSLSLFNVTLTPEAISSLKILIQSNTVIKTLGLGVIYSQLNEDQGRRPASSGGILQILPDLPRLSVLRIKICTKDDKPILAQALNRMNYLHGIRFSDTYPCDVSFDHRVVQTLCKRSQLHWLGLVCHRFGDTGLQLSRVMTNLKYVRLFKVSMSQKGWRNFIRSVLNVEHKLDVYLDKAEINEELVSMIRSYSDLKIKYNKMTDKRRRDLQFTRKWHMSQKDK